MVLRAVFFAFLVFIFFSAEGNANPTLVCIGKGNNSSSDKFYAHKINNLLNESQALEGKISALESRLPAIERELESFKQNRIPNLFREFEQRPEIKSHPTLRSTFKELKNYFYKHELQYADMLIANKKAEDEFKKEFIRINRLKVQAQEGYQKTNKIILENILKAQKVFERDFKRLDDQTRRLERRFRDQKFDLSEERRSRLTPSRWRRALGQEEQEAVRREIQEKQNQLAQQEAQQLGPLRQRRADMVSNYRATIARYRRQIETERTRHETNLAEIEKEANLNAKEYRDDLAKNRATFDSQIERDNTDFDSSINKSRAALRNHPNPGVRQYAESDGIIASIGREKDAIDALIKEKAAIPQQLEDLKQEREKYRFISQWWNEQGRYNEQASTEASVCSNCDDERTPLEAMLVTAAPKIKLQCVEASIRGKSAPTRGRLCEDSETAVGSKTNLCITQRIADYTQWALNKAFECLSDPADPIDPHLVFRKLNNESTFKFYYSDRTKGHGLTQTVNIAKNEMLGFPTGTSVRADGRKYLAKKMNQNKSKCADYKSIIDFEKEAQLDELRRRGNTNELNNLRARYPEHRERLFDPTETCNFISLDEGIHRSILNGLGLYLFYRDNYVDKDLKQLLGSGIASNPRYKEIKNYATLAYYGRNGINGGKRAIAQIRGSLPARAQNITPSQFERSLSNVKQLAYLREIRRSENAVSSLIDKNENGEVQCTDR